MAWYVAGLPRFKKFPESPDELIKKIKSSAKRAKEGPTLGQMRTQLYMLSEYLGKPIRIKKRG